MENNHIKSKDLCDRCAYGYLNSCGSREVCTGCDMEIDAGCKCMEVKDRTPCEYFKEGDRYG